jgi:opacity protein-like surface antigen
MRVDHLFRVSICLVTWLCFATVCGAQTDGRLFVGAVTGVSTLSADARSVISQTGVAVSLYKPENGPALNLLAGVHFHEYVTFQANYIWNRNSLLVTALDTGLVESSFFQQARESASHAVVGDLLLYFRARTSRIRPYLSAGVGLVRFDSHSGESSQDGLLPLPPDEVRDTGVTLRVAVGLDLEVARGWSFRYSFSESLSGNPISDQLVPSGKRNLANFQNLFGAIYRFR